MKEKFGCSGGINDFVARLPVESQRIARHAGRSKISRQDLDRVFMGRKFVENHDLIYGFAAKNINLLTLCRDVPVDPYRKLWLAKPKEGSDVAKEAAEDVSNLNLRRRATV